jgi:hypothetical protein
MSIHTKTDAATDLHPLLDHEPKSCFLCGHSLFGDSELSTGGFVHWQGTTAAISLHQFCAEQLGVNLIQDSRSLAARTGLQVKSIARRLPT